MTDGYISSVPWRKFPDYCPGWGERHKLPHRGECFIGQVIRDTMKEEKKERLLDISAGCIAAAVVAPWMLKDIHKRAGVHYRYIKNNLEHDYRNWSRFYGREWRARQKLARGGVFRLRDLTMEKYIEIRDRLIVHGKH